MNLSSKWLVNLVVCATLPFGVAAHAAMTQDQARTKLAAAFECKSNLASIASIPALVKAAGGKRDKHEVNEFGDYNTSYVLSKPISLFGQTVSSLLIWANSGDGGDASFGLNAYYSASLGTMTKAAQTKRKKVDGEWLNIRKIDNRTSLMVNVRDGRTLTFCETTVTADDY